MQLNALPLGAIRRVRHRAIDTVAVRNPDGDVPDGTGNSLTKLANGRRRCQRGGVSGYLPVTMSLFLCWWRGQ